MSDKPDENECKAKCFYYLEDEYVQGFCMFYGLLIENIEECELI